MASKLILYICFNFIHLSLSAQQQNDWSINIIHTNDMHSRFDEFLTPVLECLPKHKAAEKCFGGFARLATLIRQARASSTPTVFLNAGDTYEGTPWFNEYKWEIVTKFLNILKPDVTTLGNHEFDNGPEGLAPYLKNAKFPIVVCNLDFSKETELAEINLKKSIILNVEGKKIGVIGYLTPETQVSSNTGKVTFLDEIESIRKEVKKLQDDGVNILIGLGHSGYDVDKKIAKEVEGLDLIIGGHSHSFLYTGDVPDSDESLGPYPTVVEQKNGKKVYVVQAYAFTKYTGNLIITFDADGEIKEIKGRPILMDYTIPQAPDVVEELDNLRSKVEVHSKELVGYTKVLLYHSRDCRTKECNLGNLIADAMIDDNVRDFENDDGKWTDAAIAIVGSGTIKSSIEKSSKEAITMADIKHILPHENKIFKVQVSGEKLLEILEHSVISLQHNVVDNDPSGRFLHFSGLHVFYDTSKPNGFKVVQDLLLIRCADCAVPKYEKWNKDKSYIILANEFIATGGDGYQMLKDTTPLSIGITLEQCLANYIKRRSTVFPSVEGRIQFVDPNENSFIDVDIETIVQLMADE